MPRLCPSCSNPIGKNDKLCPYCDAPTDSLPKATINASGDVVAASNQISALITRYKDAYLVAGVTNGFGKFVKVSGIVVGALIVLMGMGLMSDAKRGGTYGRGMESIGQSDITSSLGMITIVGGIAIGLFFYIVGVLISAQGQILKASLDGAVNSSPFLTNEHRAKIMSLPEA